MQDKMTEIIEEIQKSDYLLIGIGEEFSARNSLDVHSERYAAFWKKGSEQELARWLPFLEYDYFTKLKDIVLDKMYMKLQEILQNKDFFLVSTCMDDYIYTGNIPKERIVTPCGGYSKLQCIQGCTDTLYHAEDPVCFVDNVVEALLDEYKVLQEIQMPKCPFCGKDLVFHTIKLAARYIETDYLPQWEKYTKWLQNTLYHKVCILELGVNLQYPSMMRWPFEKIAFLNKQAKLVRVNKTLYQLPETCSSSGISISMESVHFLKKI